VRGDGVHGGKLFAAHVARRRRRQSHHVERSLRLRGLLLFRSHPRAGAVGSRAGASGSDRAGHRGHTYRHDPPVQSGGRMSPRRSALLKLLLLGAALTPWLAQAAAEAASAPAASAKKTPAKAAPAGDGQILLQADQVVYDGDAQTVSAVGHVEIVDQGRILDADTVTYNQKTDQVTADGHVTVTDALGNVAFSNHVVLTDHMRDGALQGFGALIGKNGRLAATSAQRVGGTMVIAHQTNYSPCKICNQPGQRTPVWQVKAEKVVYDQIKHRIHFTDATLDVFGIPILYTPVLSEPDPTVKYASGLLAPDVGNSTKIGYFARIPYYFAISPTNDLTVAPQFSTEGGELVEGEYRARWNNSGMWLQGSAAYNGNGGLGGGTGPPTFDHLFG